jgi:hypothetical protein
MLPPQLRKFSELYATYGLGAVKNVWLLTCLLPLARTVNLYKMKDFVGGVLEKETTKADSHYKRLIRFFQDWSNNEALFQDLVRHNLRFLRGLGFKTLVMDGTSWTIGEAKVHYLVLSVLVESVAVPIYWVQLEKAGASSQQERMKMFEAALALFNLKGMTLLADREYIGKDWFKFLKEKNIDFVIRLRTGDYFEEVNTTPGKDYERMLWKCGVKNRLVKKRIYLDGTAFWMLLLPNPKVEAEEAVLIFLTTLPPTEKTARMYAKRWKIECLFLHLKTNGYNLEDLNLKDPNKNRLILAIVTIAYTLSVREGWKRRRYIAVNRYRDGSQTPEVSVFREGLAILTTKCFKLIDFLRYVFKALMPQNHAICKNVQ